MSKYHKILGVAIGASKDEIKKAYRKLALTYHPDVNPNNEDLFKQILEAYQFLINDINQETLAVKESEEKVFVRKYNKWFTKSEVEEMNRLSKIYVQNKAKHEKEQKFKEYNELLNSKTYKWFNYVIVLAIILSSILTLDYYLPLKKESWIVSDIELHTRIEEDPFTNISIQIIHSEVSCTNNKGKKTFIYFEHDLSSLIKIDEPILILKSQIFNVKTGMQSHIFEFKTVWFDFRLINIILSIIYILLVFFASISKGPTPLYYILLNLSVWGIPISFIIFLLFVLTV